MKFATKKTLKYFFWSLNAKFPFNIQKNPFVFQNSSHLDYLSKYDDSNGVDGYENGESEVVNLSKISKHQINGSSEKKIQSEVSLENPEKIKIFNPTPQFK